MKRLSTLTTGKLSLKMLKVFHCIMVIVIAVVIVNINFIIVVCCVFF